MIPMELYQMFHLVMVVLTLTCYGLTLHGNNDKIYKILSGVGSLFILVTGMGFLARLGYTPIDAPVYIYIKMIIFVVIAAGAPIIGKRCPQHGKKFFWLMLVLFSVVAYLVSYKPI